MTFRLLASCPRTGARAGLLGTAHGEIPTPAFMPVGTLASVKSLSSRDVRGIGARCVLANTYHLALRPGADLIRRLGGLHHFMGWSGPILTDSGGFQAFSLAALRETSEAGVRFRSHIDGQPLELTPENVVETQEQLGSDIAMPLDVCLGKEATPDEAADAVARTRRWAVRSMAAKRRQEQLLFGIVQGGIDPNLRREAARELGALGFPGYAIGGLSVGEPLDLTRRLVAVTAAALPNDRPRYLMGVGTPEQVLAYTALGVDMFDCVLPTRLGRTGVAFGQGRRLTLRRPEFRTDSAPIDSSCDCPTCARYSRAFLRDALHKGQPLAARLVSLHNCRALVRTAERARAAIVDGTFPGLLAELAISTAEPPASALAGGEPAGRGARAPVGPR